MRRSLALTVPLLVMAACATPPQRFDLIIRGGQVYDGVAAEPQRVDVGITGDRIVAVGALTEASASEEIDASGLAVAPGFIDVQSHSGATLLADGAGESHLRQGVTSEILGDVDSPAFWTPQTADVAILRPFGVAFDWSGFDGYFERVLQRGIAVNIGTLIPLSKTDGSAAVIDQAMRRGALGVAITRGDGADLEMTTADLIAVARIVAGHGGSVAMQASGTRDQVTRTIDEAIELARQAKLPVVLYEPEVRGDPNALREVLAKVQTARAEGVGIHVTTAPGAGDTDDARGWWFRDAGASVGSRSAAVRADSILARRIAHPRAYGAFAEVLSDYVRVDNVLSLGEAIRRMTSNAADQFRLEGRGVIRSGSVADLVVFDPARVTNNATLAQPHQYATGMQHVIVNGVTVLNPSGLTGARPGRPLFGRARVSERPSS